MGRYAQSAGDGAVTLASPSTGQPSLHFTPNSRDQQPATAPGQPHNRRRAAGLVRAAGGVLATASCLPMVAMLPGAAATALATLGVEASAGPWAALRHALDPVARPLLVLSVLLLVAGHPHRNGTTDGPLFYAGVGLIATTFAWSAIRRRRRTCRPAWLGSTGSAS